MKIIFLKNNNKKIKNKKCVPFFLRVCFYNWIKILYGYTYLYLNIKVMFIIIIYHKLKKGNQIIYIIMSLS